MKIYCSGLLIFAACLAGAQNHDLKPSEMLKSLDFITGDWKGDQNFNTQGGPAMVGKVTAHMHSAVSGHYIEESLTTALPGRAPADVRHFLAYDTKAGKFKVWWFNDTAVGPTELEGELHGNKLELMTPSTAPSGRPVMRATYEKISDKKLSYKLEMKQGDGWMELFHTDYSK